MKWKKKWYEKKLSPQIVSVFMSMVYVSGVQLAAPESARSFQLFGNNSWGVSRWNTPALVWGCGRRFWLKAVPGRFFWLRETPGDFGLPISRWQLIQGAIQSHSEDLWRNKQRFECIRFCTLCGCSIFLAILYSLSSRRLKRPLSYFVRPVVLSNFSCPQSQGGVKTGNGKRKKVSFEDSFQFPLLLVRKLPQA